MNLNSIYETNYLSNPAAAGTIEAVSVAWIVVVAQNSERPIKAGDFRATAIPLWA
jgi:hypothetical protein